jgi:ribose transport system substrate-binding protein
MIWHEIERAARACFPAAGREGEPPMPSNMTRRTMFAAAAAAAAMGALPRPAAAADPVATATITPFGASVTGKARPGPWRIGFANGYAASPWRAMCVAAIQQEAAARPQQIAQLLVRDGKGRIERQIDQIRGLVRARVDAILCIPNSPDAVAAALADATAQGIVTVPFNLPVEGENWSCYVASDPVQKGRAMGEWLLGALNRQGKIVALGGVPGNPYTAACWAGTQAVLQGTAITPLNLTAGWWQRDRARSVMAGLIAAYPEIDGIWCDGGQDATGAMEAMIAAHRRLVPVTGDDYNGLLKLYAALGGRDPGFTFALVSEPSWQGVIALRAALTLLGGGSVAKRQLVQPALITPANYQQYIRPRLPDAALVDTTLDDATLARIFG